MNLNIAYIMFTGNITLLGKTFFLRICTRIIEEVVLRYRKYKISANVVKVRAAIVIG